MTKTETFTFLTRRYNEMINITKTVEELVQESGVQNGMVTVMTLHTTTGVTVNEALECLESDIGDFLARLVPENAPYAHAHMLRDYGSTAGNATGHLKAHLTGNHCHFALVGGVLQKGGAQEVYFCEFDGPASRTVQVMITGE